MAYDTVVSIGGQSLVDGVWHLLGPAIEELSNPLPLALPGFSDAEMRITHIVPVIPGTVSGALEVLALVEVTAEALLKVNLDAGNVTVSLGPQTLHLTNLAGTMGLPARTGTLSNIAISGVFPPPTGLVNLGPGTGTLDVTAGPGNFTNGDFTGALEFPNDLTVPTIPLPAVVPVAVNLTPNAPLPAAAILKLTATGITQATRFSLAIVVGETNISAITLDPALVTNLTATLQTAVNGIVQQLGVPAAIVQNPIDPNAVTALLAPVPGVIQSSLADALKRLLGETGRLIYPPAGSGASCDVEVLPSVADTRIGGAADGSYVLQLGFGRSTSTDITSLPTALPAGSMDTTLLVGNKFLLKLLGCLLRRLPGLTLPVDATESTTDVRNPPRPHMVCFNFTGATVDFNLIALTGGVSLCLDSFGDNSKSVSLVGHFDKDTNLVNITVNFELPLIFDLDSAAALTNLRMARPPTVDVDISVRTWVWIFLGGLAVAGGFLSWLTGSGAAAIVVGVILLIVGTLLVAICKTARDLLKNSVNTILREAALVSSPAAVPSGVFDAFGGVVPVTVSVDDLTARSVLQTPTQPWALLPRLGFGKPRRPRSRDPEK
jgi:hypothetical protein